MNYRERDLNHLWHLYTNINHIEKTDFPVMESGSGVKLKDINGKEYYDGISSWWCVNLGHSHPVVTKAISEQAKKLQHSIIGGFSHTAVIELSEKLAELAPGNLNRVYYASDGASGIEAAIRIVIQYWWNQGMEAKKNIISLEGGYHGDTLGTVGLGYLPKFHTPIKHVVNRAMQASSPHCFHCGFEDYCNLECFKSMEQKLRENSNNTAAVIVEPLCQGAAGIRIYPPEYLVKLRALCNELDVLLIADEIAVGFGRTGKMFASEYAGIVPDVLVVGKSLTAGYLPMSAVITNDKIFSTFKPTEKLDTTFYHGHTFAGNPIAAAAANAAIKVFEEENILKKCKIPFKIMKESFSKFVCLPGVYKTETLGCMSSLEISEEAGGHETAVRIGQLALKKGLIIRPLGAILYLWPPLTTSKEEMTEMLSIFEACLREVLE